MEKMDVVGVAGSGFSDGLEVAANCVYILISLFNVVFDLSKMASLGCSSEVNLLAAIDLAVALRREFGWCQDTVQEMLEK